MPANPRRGWLLELRGEVVPGMWDAEEAFRSGEATGAVYLTPAGVRSPTLALRAGGGRVWGRYPYFEAARVGGEGTVRGYSQGRFLGDAAMFGSAELRAPLGRARLLVPGQLGVLGFTEAGRVLLEGESSQDWHEAAGAGLWFAALGPSNTVSMTVARSPERTTFYLKGGMAF